MSAPLRPFELACPDLSAERIGNTDTPGVWHFDSGVPGRHVMISALVHGNELCGAWALKTFLASGLRPSRTLPEADPLQFHIAIGYVAESARLGPDQAQACLERMVQAVFKLRAVVRKKHAEDVAHG